MFFNREAFLFILAPSGHEDHEAAGIGGAE